MTRRLSLWLAAVPLLAALGCAAERDPRDLLVPAGVGTPVVDAMLIVGLPFPGIYVTRTLASDLGRAVEPAVTLRRGGATVTVIGLGRLANERPELAPATAAVREAIAAVRAESDAVVLLSHLGTELDRALLATVSGVDALLGGHSHDLVPPPTTALDCGPLAAAELGCTPRPVPLVHAGAYGRHLGRVEFLVSRAPEDARTTESAASGVLDRRGVVVETQVEHLVVGSDLAEEPHVADALAPFLLQLVADGAFRPLAFAPRRVGRFGAGGGDSALGNFVAAAARAGTGADLAVIPSSAIRADVEEGEITPERLHRALPFEDRLIALTPTGAELMTALRRLGDETCRDRSTAVQVDGATLTFTCGALAIDARIAGRPVDLVARYRLITTTFLTHRSRPLALPGRIAGDPAGGEPLRNRVEATLRGLSACGPAPRDLPCLDSVAGALADGRIRVYSEPGPSP
jgi:2',3'-cyclic-nucleotide 2'-phosphodiesterase (5'-nucleotidase family)